MKCPNCGAENTEEGLYCGSCASQMKEFAPVERKEAMPEQLPPELDKVLSGRFLRSGVIFALILGALQLVEIATGEASGLDIALGVACIVAATAMLVFLRRQKSRGGTDVLRRHISVGMPFAPEEVVASARSIGLAGVVALSGFALMGAGFLVMAALFYDGGPDLGWLLPAAMGAGMLAIIGLTARKAQTDVILSRDGMVIRSPAAGMTFSFKRSELSALEMKGRVLRVALSNPPFGMFRQSRHLLLGDVGERERFAQAVAAYGLQGPGRG
ncbi:MAG: TFIIB-type zinc ribbon-containing protein [Candidatus Thermoplasmatota archaeon]